jgi:uncharacterized linocin/CFP29 family protein
MDHLFRALAPISTAAWAVIEDEARRTLETTLAGRKLVDFRGPLGWDASSVGTGRSTNLNPPPGSEAEARLRKVLPLVELRVPFTLRRSEIDVVDRGAEDPDTEPVVTAARKIAIAEDRAIFHGHPDAGIRGLCEARSEVALRLGDDVAEYPALIATALKRLGDRGVDGPYAVALSEQAYTGLIEATQSGYPVLEHVRRLVSGPLISAPGLEGALVLSQRGDDFALTVGQDFSIGYLAHDAEQVRLYIEESFTFLAISPDAAVAISGKISPA